MQFSTILSLLAVLSVAHAHMHMNNPPPIREKDNPNCAAGDVDFNYDAPLSPSGSDFPCKGYHLKATDAEKKPVATWQAGSQQQVTIVGGAAHEGGSCQISISEDNGQSFKVCKSFIGNCPLSGTSSFAFTVPPETKNGNILLAWSWFNKVGNREMYMNCAEITVTGGGSGLTDSSKFPDMFVANVGNGCTTVEGGDTLFPNPGPNVDNKSSKTVPPVGNCGSSGGNVPPAKNSSPPQQSSSSAQTPTGAIQSSVSQPPATTEPSVTTQPGVYSPPVQNQPSATSQPGASQPPVQNQPPATTQPGAYPPPVKNQPSATTQPGASQPPVQNQPSATTQPGVYSPPVKNQPSATTQPGASQPPVENQPSATKQPAQKTTPITTSSCTTPHPTVQRPPPQTNGAQPTTYPPPPKNTSTPPQAGSCTDGEIICDSANEFSVCSNGKRMKMGSTAPGTVCKNGAITKRNVQQPRARRYIRFRA